MEELPTEVWEEEPSIELCGILPRELWEQVLGYLMPGEVHLHVKWSSPAHKTLSHRKCYLNERETIVRDICSFGRTCKEALKMRDRIFHAHLCLHFDSKIVLRKFSEIHPRFTTGKTKKDHQSFKKIHLALYKADDSAIRKLQHIKHLYGVSLFEVYLLQSPGEKVLDKELIHKLEKTLRDKVKEISIMTFGFRSVNLWPRFSYDRRVKWGLEIRQMEIAFKTNHDGYAYGFPHENCKLAQMLQDVKERKQAYMAIHGDVRRRRR